MYGKLKNGLADVVVEFTTNLRSRRTELLEDKEIKEKIYAASEGIRERAKQTLREVREITGLMAMK